MGSNFHAELPRPNPNDIATAWRVVRHWERVGDANMLKDAQALSRVLSHYTQMLDLAALAGGAQHQPNNRMEV